MDASPIGQRIKWEEIPTWAEEFNENRVELTKYVATTSRFRPTIIKWCVCR